MIELKNVVFIKGTYDEVLSYFRNDLKVLSAEEFSKLEPAAKSAIGVKREIHSENGSVEDQLKIILNNKPTIGRVFTLDAIDYTPFPGNPNLEIPEPRPAFRVTGYYVDITNSANIVVQALNGELK